MSLTANPAIVSWATCSEDRAGLALARPTLIFFAGRIDNRSGLASALGSSTRESDATLSELAYLKYGPKCPASLHGDFAFAVWDPRRCRVFAARDAAGCQPIYYYSGADFFAVAESIEQLLTVGDIERDLDEPFVASALTRFYTHPERTFLSQVRKIPPGHTLMTGPNSMSLERYWSPEDVPRQKWKDERECAEAFHDVISQAVRDRLPADGGVGVHLSGGLDCSSVAILATEELRRAGRPEPIAFSWQPPQSAEAKHDGEGNEYRPIESVCAKARLTPRYCPLSKQDVLTVLQRDDTVRRICGSTYNEWPAMREASARGVKVMMSGFGGDEAASFNGRGFYNGLALRGRWLRLYREAKAVGINPVRFWAGALKRSLEHLILPERVLSRVTREGRFKIPRWKILARSIRSTEVDSFLLSDEQWQQMSEYQSYLNPDFQKSVDMLPLWSTIRETSARAAQRHLIQQGNFSYRIESWAADGARHGIRYVYPLLDRRVLEFVLSLPEDAFMNHEYSRLIFRRAMQPVLPADVCWRPKLGEPNRCGLAMSAMQEALIEVGNRLRAGQICSPRAAYLDMPRLARDLTREAVEKRTRFAKLFFAVQFLGLNQ